MVWISSRRKLLPNMMHLDAVKSYKTPIDGNGEYREYSVCAEGNSFVFECWDCREKTNGTGVGSRKMHQKWSTLEEAVRAYEDCIEKWEDLPKKCPKCESNLIKKTEDGDDFAHVKSEGAPAYKAKNKTIQGYYCHSCQHRWEETI